MSVLVVAAALAGLKLTLAPQASRILVAEPLMVKVTIEADSRAYLPEGACGGGQELAAGTFRFLRDGPGGPAGFTESTVGDVLRRTVMTKPGGRCTAELRLVYGPIEGAGSDYLFPAPGTYTVRVQFQTLVSEPVTIHVDAPTGEEAEVLAAIRQNPFAIVWWSGSDGDLLRARYPTSRYFIDRRPRRRQ